MKDTEHTLRSAKIIQALSNEHFNGVPISNTEATKYISIDEFHIYWIVNVLMNWRGKERKLTFLIIESEEEEEYFIDEIEEEGHYVYSVITGKLDKSPDKIDGFSLYEIVNDIITDKTLASWTLPMEVK